MTTKQDPIFSHFAGGQKPGVSAGHIFSKNTGIIFKLPHLISWPAPARGWVLDMKSSRDEVSDYQLTPVFHYHFSTAMLMTAHMTPWL